MLSYLHFMRIFRITTLTLLSLLLFGFSPIPALASKINVPTNFLVLNTGLVGWWTFDGKDTVWPPAPAATTLDKSGNGNPAPFPNGAKATSPTIGKIGQGLKFDGVDDIIEVTQSSSINDPLALTVSVWAKQSTLKTNGYYISKADNSSGGHGWSFGSGNVANSSLSFVVHGFTTTDLSSISASGVITTNSWNHYVVTWDGSNTAANVRMYKNGVEVSYATQTNGGSATPQSDSARNIKFARESGTGSTFFNVNMDDVRVYNRALSPSEVTALYNAGSAKFNKTPTDALTDGLVGHWTFDGKDTVWTSATAATTLDKSGQGNTGTLTNMAQATSPAIGKIGQGLKFDGGGDYVEKTDVSSLDITGALTLSAWIYTHSQKTDNAGIISKYRNQTGSTNQRAYELYVQDNAVSGGIGMAISDDGTFKADGVLESGANVITLNKWHHVVARFEPSTSMRLYVDGVQVASDTTSILSSVANTAAPLWIGIQLRSTDPNMHFDGLIDDVSIYNRALSANEVLQLYNLGR